MVIEGKHLVSHNLCLKVVSRRRIAVLVHRLSNTVVVGLEVLANQGRQDLRLDLLPNQS